MGQDERRLVLMALLSAWALVWGYSFYALLTLPPEDAAQPEPGLTRMSAFLGWQLAAAVLAFAVWAFGRAWPRDSGVRRVANMPLQLASAIGAVLAGLILWAMLAGKG